MWAKQHQGHRNENGETPTAQTAPHRKSKRSCQGGGFGLAQQQTFFPPRISLDMSANGKADLESSCNLGNAALQMASRAGVGSNVVG